MQITIDVDENVDETKIKISCNRLTREVEQVIAAIRMLNKQLVGRKDGEIFLLNLEDVIYLESVERKCFIYTEKETYEAELKLYEMEQGLEEYGFIRVSKSCLIHLKYVKSLKTEINQKIRITLKNGEQLIASRQYAIEFKQRLGVK